MAICPEYDIGSSYALLWQEGRIANTALYGGLQFDSVIALPEEDYRSHGDVVTVARRGTYLIEWKLFVPADVAVDTRVSLHACGAELPGGSLSVIHGRGDAGSLYSARSIISLLADAPLRLSSSRVISYAADAHDALASLLIARL